MPAMIRRTQNRKLPFLPVPSAEDTLAAGAQGNPDASAPQQQDMPVGRDGKINWMVLLAPLIGAGAGALIGGKQGAVAGATAGGGFTQGYGQEKIRQQEFGFQQEQEAARQKAEADRLALGKEQLSATREATELENTRADKDRAARESQATMERTGQMVESALTRAQRGSEFSAEQSLRRELAGTEQTAATERTRMGVEGRTTLSEKDIVELGLDYALRYNRDVAANEKQYMSGADGIKMVREAISKGQAVPTAGGPKSNGELVKEAAARISEGKSTLQEEEQKISALPYKDEEEQAMIQALREQATSGTTPSRGATQPVAQEQSPAPTEVPTPPGGTKFAIPGLQTQAATTGTGDQQIFAQRKAKDFVDRADKFIKAFGVDALFTTNQFLALDAATQEEVKRLLSSPAPTMSPMPTPAR